MQFANPALAGLFWIVFALMVFYLWVFKAKKAAMERFAQKHLVSELAFSFDAKKSWIKALIVLAACALCIVALLRPQWGFKWEQVKKRGVDIFIALDVSKSMLAEDVKPNRLERSKLAILDMLKSLHGDRVGLIAFAGSAFIQCPLTSDYTGFLLSLNDIDVNTIPKGGTSVSCAIKESLAGFEGGVKKYRVLVIISDGEDHEGEPVEKAKAAAKEGVVIYTVGIGSLQGVPIPLYNEQGFQTGYKRDRRGGVVTTKLDELTLEKIALETGGKYYRATPGEVELEKIYDDISGMEKKALASQQFAQFEDRFQIFLGAALLCFALEMLVSERRRSRIEWKGRFG